MQKKKPYCCRQWGDFFGFRFGNGQRDSWLDFSGDQDHTVWILACNSTDNEMFAEALRWGEIFSLGGGLRSQNGLKWQDWGWQRQPTGETHQFHELQLIWWSRTRRCSCVVACGFWQEQIASPADRFALINIGNKDPCTRLSGGRGSSLLTDMMTSGLMFSFSLTKGRCLAPCTWVKSTVEQIYAI